MKDTIYREDAIDALGERPDVWTESDWERGQASRWDYDVAAIKNVPSAQPEQKWIPCSERLPDEREWIGTKKFGTTISDEVYVTFQSPGGERFCRHTSFQNGKISTFDQITIDACFKGSVPVAWMPLPEPWKGEQDETD